MSGATDQDELPYEIRLAMVWATMQLHQHRRLLTTTNQTAAYEAMAGLLQLGSSVVEYSLGVNGWQYTGTRQLIGIVNQNERLQLQFEDDGSGLAQTVDLALDGSVDYFTQFDVLYIRTPMEQVTLTNGNILQKQEGHHYNGVPNQTHVLLMYAPVDN
jgi:hypothetical protein